MVVYLLLHNTFNMFSWPVRTQSHWFVGCSTRTTCSGSLTCGVLVYIATRDESFALATTEQIECGKVASETQVCGAMEVSNAAWTYYASGVATGQ